MNLKEAHELAISEMDSWQLISQGWTFSFNRRRTSFGLCDHTKKQIQLSKITAENEPRESVLNTIRHEIAHAIAGSRADHGIVWQRVARIVGCTDINSVATPTIETREAITKTIKYVMVCPKGFVVKTYLRKPSKSTFAKLGSLRVRNRPDTHGKLAIEEYNPSIHLVRA